MSYQGAHIPVFHVILGGSYPSVLSHTIWNTMECNPFHGVPYYTGGPHWHHCLDWASPPCPDQMLPHVWVRHYCHVQVRHYHHVQARHYHHVPHSSVTDPCNIGFVHLPVKAGLANTGQHTQNWAGRCFVNMQDWYRPDEHQYCKSGTCW